MLEAMASRELITWADIDDGMEISQVSWESICGLTNTFKATFVILSRLDSEGSLVAWTVKPGEAQPAMTVFDAHELLAQVGGSWSSLMQVLFDAGGCAPEAARKQTSSSSSEQQRVLSLLYKCCWAPIAAKLGESKHVVMCAQGELARVPWMALLDEHNKAVGDTWSVAIEPCVSLLVSAVEVRRSPSLYPHSDLGIVSALFVST
jgi:hypothetical protein